jgi:glyoxylase-like metal-dependent hydrolase (beta-lactamase superfamily II)
MDIKILLKGFSGATSRGSLSMGTVVLVQTEHKRLLIDTGAFSARRVLMNQLSAVGVAPDAIDMVLLTHLHHDHCANIDLFSKAQFVLSEKEWHYANRQCDIHVQKPMIQLLHQYNRRMIREDGALIVEGIRALKTPGHTPGELTFMLEDGGKCIAVTGDAVKNRQELAGGNIAMTYDEALSRSSISRIRALADYVIPGHDVMLDVSDKKSVIPVESNELVMSFIGGLSANGGCTTLKIVLD